MGRKIRVASSMIQSVSWLEEASQTVKLAFGSLDEGRRNGKRARPAVAMIPMIIELDPSSAVFQARRSRPIQAKPAPRKPSTGATNVQGRLL